MKSFLKLIFFFITPPGLIVLLISYWNQLWFLEKASSGLNKKTCTINANMCFQAREVYKEIASQILYDSQPLGLFFGYKKCGKSTFLHDFSCDNDGVYYIPLTYESILGDSKILVPELIDQIFPGISADNWWRLLLQWLDKLFNYYSNKQNDSAHSIDKLAEKLHNEQLSQNLIGQLGRRPIIIIDNVEYIKEFPDKIVSLLNFIDKGVNSGYYKVILAGNDRWVIEHFSYMYHWDPNIITEIRSIPDMNIEESIKYHKCKRQNDSDITILHTYEYLKGSLILYNDFMRAIKNHDQVLEKPDADYIIKALIEEQRGDFKRSKIYFNHLDEDINNHIDGETKERIQKSLQLIYLLIKNKGSIPEKEADYYLERDKKGTKNYIFKTFYDFDKKLNFVDFKTNLHRLYAIQELGLSDDKNSSNTGYFEKISNILKEKWAFTFKEPRIK